MSSKTILVSYGVEFDAVAGRPGSGDVQRSPLELSLGMFAAEIGTPRLLTLFERFEIATTWFIPGHCIETFPDPSRMVVDAGHEVGLHGYGNERPIAMSQEQEAAVLDRSIELVSALGGASPRGYAAPGRAFSPATAGLLLSRGIVYDRSLMHDDVRPYYLRAGDRCTPVDYSEPAQSWMKPLVRGTSTSLIEIPASRYLDDAADAHGVRGARVMEEIWRDTFDWVYRESDYAVFPMTVRPGVSGRPQALLVHERLFDYMSGHPGVHFVTMNEIADDFRKRSPPPA